MTRRRLVHSIRSSLVLLLLSASTAAALDFSGEHRVYREDYSGEVSYPTTPEIDRVMVGGAIGFDLPSGGSGPDLTGGAAHATVDLENTNTDLVVFAPGDLAVGNFGARGEFAETSMVGDGGHAASVVATSAVGDTQLLASVVVSRTGASVVAALELLERDIPTQAFLAFSSVGLSTEEAAALLAGAPFTIDLFVDRAGTAFASIQIGPFASVQTAIPLMQLGSAVLSALGTSLQVGGGVSEVDMTAFELYSALRRSFNIDVGAAQGTPTSSYGAAGPAGLWNTIGLGTTPLVDTDGNPSSVTASLSTQADDGDFVGGSPNEEALSGDHAFECVGNPDVWTLSFAGLPRGSYRVLIYAPANNFIHTGEMIVNGQNLPNLTGDSGFELIQGVSWGETTVSTSGAIDLSGTVDNALCAGISGIQLIPVPRHVPSLPWLGFGLLAALLALTGGRAISRR